MIALKVRATGMKELEVRISRISGAARNLAPAWPTVVTALRSVEAQVFASEGGFSRGGRWKPLSRRYALRKARLRPGAKILEYSGRLRGSLTGSSSDSIYRPGPRSLEYGTSVPYARYHQEGGGFLPRRSFLDLTDRQASTIGAILHRYIVSESARGITSRAGLYVGDAA